MRRQLPPTSIAPESGVVIAVRRVQFCGEFWGTRLPYLKPGKREPPIIGPAMFVNSIARHPPRQVIFRW